VTPPRAVTTEWWLYVIECKGGSLYTGIAVDVARRYSQHCRGIGATYTRMRPPLRLIGAMSVGTRSAASKLEYAFKQLTPPEKRVRALAMGVAAEPTTAGGDEST
jgi:putative endonuclease